MTLAETIAAELEAARRNVATCEEGKARNPDDLEWPIMLEAARERFAAIERIDTAHGWES